MTTTGKMVYSIEEAAEQLGALLFVHQGKTLTVIRY